MRSSGSGAPERRSALRSIAAAIGYLPEAIAGVAMLAVTVILFAGVVWRYFLVAPLAWTDEIARLVFVWLTFVGAALGVKRGLHASVAILANHMSPGWRRLSAIFVVGVIAVVAVVLVKVGGVQAASAFRQEAMPTTGLSTGWTNVAVPISGILMLIYLVPHIVALLRPPGMDAPRSEGAAPP